MYIDKLEKSECTKYLDNAYSERIRKFVVITK